MTKKLNVAWKTVKDQWKMTAILTTIFMGFSALYIGVYPSIKDMLDQFTEMPQFGFIRGFKHLGTFPGFLNMELYQIFWILVLPMLIAYISASLISEGIESKTINLLMATPVSRKRIVVEKFLGVVPLILTVNFATMGTVYGLASVIGEEISFTHLSITHLSSIPYFLAVASISLLLSTIINKKMKASITGMAIMVGMYLLESISQLAPEYHEIGQVSLIHYYDPSQTLIEGNIDSIGTLTLIAITAISLLIAIEYFQRRNIEI